MSMANKMVLQVDHNSRNQRSMHHHLLVHLYSEIKVSIVARIRSTSRIDRLSLMVVWHKEEIGIMHVLSVVNNT